MIWVVCMKPTLLWSRCYPLVNMSKTLLCTHKCHMPIMTVNLPQLILLSDSSVDKITAWSQLYLRHIKSPLNKRKQFSQGQSQDEITERKISNGKIYNCKLLFILLSK
jgi:hypothetical protein